MLEEVGIFLSAGGRVLWVIFFVLLALWFFIFERFYYFYKIYPVEKKRIKESWMKREDKTSWFCFENSGRNHIPNDQSNVPFCSSY